MSILNQLGTKIGSKLKELTTLVGTKLDKTEKAADSALLDGMDSSAFVFGDDPSATSQVTNFDAITKSGFYDGSSTTIGNPFGDWAWLIHHEHSNENGYGFQIALKNGNASIIKVRTQHSNTWSVWEDMIFDGGTISGQTLFNFDDDSGDYCQVRVKGTDNHSGIILDAAPDRQTHLRFATDGALKWQIRVPHQEDGIDSNLKIYSWVSNLDSFEFTHDAKMLISGNEVYHAGNKPTPTDIGTYSTTELDTSIETAKLVINNNISSSAANLSEAATIYSTSIHSRNDGSWLNLSGGVDNTTIQALTDDKLSVATIKLNPFGGDVSVNGNSIYHAGNKPTPTDIGTYSTSEVDSLISNVSISSTTIDWVITGTGVTSSDGGHTLRRQVHNNVWDSQAYCLTPTTKVSFMIDEGDAENNHAMIGLNTDPEANANYNTIDYAWYINNGSTSAYESGASFSTGTTWNTNSIYSLEYDGANVVYRQDGVVKRTVSVGAGKTYYVDSSFHSDAIISNITMGYVSPVAGTYAFEAMSNTASGQGGTGIISFATIRHNSGNAFNGSRFTAPIKGFYQFNGTVLANSASITRLDLMINGTVVYRTESTQAASGYQAANSIQAVHLQAGDYVEFSSGIHATYGNTYNYCSGYLIK